MVGAVMPTGEPGPSQRNVAGARKSVPDAVTRRGQNTAIIACGRFYRRACPAIQPCSLRPSSCCLRFANGSSQAVFTRDRRAGLGPASCASGLTSAGRPRRYDPYHVTCTTSAGADALIHGGAPDLRAGADRAASAERHSGRNSRSIVSRAWFRDSNRCWRSIDHADAADQAVDRTASRFRWRTWCQCNSGRSFRVGLKHAVEVEAFAQGGELPVKPGPVAAGTGRACCRRRG